MLSPVTNAAFELTCRVRLVRILKPRFDFDVIIGIDTGAACAGPAFGH